MFFDEVLEKIFQRFYAANPFITYLLSVICLVCITLFLDLICFYSGPFSFLLLKNTNFGYVEHLESLTLFSIFLEHPGIFIFLKSCKHCSIISNGLCSNLLVCSYIE